MNISQHTEEIGRSRNLNRKLKELVTALKIESTYSKDEILEAYLNTRAISVMNV